jgi:putative PIN family toxin of toxin-antitoxin system
VIVCIDTSTLVQALAAGHPFRPITDAWIAGRITLAVSTPILLEYEEVITRMSGVARWQRLARLTEMAELTTGNLLHIAPSFHFRIISDDEDDNIVTDRAVAAEADFIVTEDRHFAALAKGGYKPQPITPTAFIEQFLSGG